LAANSSIAKAALDEYLQVIWMAFQVCWLGNMKQKLRLAAAKQFISIESFPE
jgi:hypothetical protein